MSARKAWRVALALLVLSGSVNADVVPPVHDATCTAARRARFPGECIECCMGDGCPHPEQRCPAEERFKVQRCVRHPGPESALTYSIYCDPTAKPSGLALIGMIARVPAVWIGASLLVLAAVAVGWRLRKR